jgi:hypothetical protein
MATAQDLLLSILALDAYNRGYNSGMTGLSDAIGAKIGDASIIATSAAQDAGFYGVAYNTPYGTVISYRGTTFELGANTLLDVINGWTLSAGYAQASQPQLAEQFYAAVARLPQSGSPQDFILTGVGRA